MAARRVTPQLLEDFPLPEHPEHAGKEDRGRLLVIAGSKELAGAALLAGVAGLRAGAGKLQIATAESIALALAVRVPEARVIGFGEAGDGCIAPGSVKEVLGWADKAQGVAIGCGLRHGAGLDRLLAGLLGQDAGIPLVLDAAALAGLPALAREMRAYRGGTVLLPHAGEMAALLDRSREAVEADPHEAAAAAAERFGAVAVVKGQQSWIVAPDGRAFRHDGGGVGLATSGSGDVLAGIVGGLAARGADALTAALWGVWLHGRAGESLGRKIGRLGFLAREIADAVPALLPE
jgi:ADP-dependent NAD(P)H-hydrate dehydratase